MKHVKLFEEFSELNELFGFGGMSDGDYALIYTGKDENSKKPSRIVTKFKGKLYVQDADSKYSVTSGNEQKTIKIGTILLEDGLTTKVLGIKLLSTKGDTKAAIAKLGNSPAAREITELMKNNSGAMKDVKSL